MAINLQAIAPETLAEYINIGERYGSENTLAQADATLDALANYGDALIVCGFSAGDATRLADARAGLLDAGVQRRGARIDTGQQRMNRASVLDEGKLARELSRSVLDGTRLVLKDLATPAARSAVEVIVLTLQHTSSLNGGLLELGEQLAELKTALLQPAVAEAAADRGGAEAVATLTQALSSVQQTPATTKAGTPQQTQQLNTFDGIIVTLCRRARKAARVAARKTGTPALANAFRLVHLDEASSGPAGSPPAPPPAPAP